MNDYDQLYQQGLYLSPNEQDLLMAAISSNRVPENQPNTTPQAEPDQSPDHTSSNGLSAPPSGGFDNSQLHTLGFGEDESPFLDFAPGVDFEFSSDDLIGDLPGSAHDYEPGDKRKSIDGKSDVASEDAGKKRRESENKKPGRKPLTSEPTTVR